jgi:flagellar hook-length control protein FliK
MTAAIAIPVTTTPASSAVANGAASAKGSQNDGEGFAAELASSMGGSSNTPQAHAAPHAPKSLRGAASASDTQTDPSAVPVVPVVPSLILTPAQQTQAQASAAQQASAATQISAQAAQGSALQILQAAANSNDKAQAADGATADQTAAAPSSPQPTAAAGAFAALLADAQQSKQPQAPAHANTKVQAKPNAAAKPAAQPANALKPLDAAADGKPATSTSTTAAVAHASANNSNGDTQTGSGKSETAVPQVQGAATSFTIALHTSSTDAPTAAAQTAPTAAAIPLDAVAVQMARKFESGESRFEIRLDPIELGKLDISMTVAEDGRVQAVVRAERPETLDMLQRDARVLENQLRQSGLNVDSNSLSFSLGGGGNNQRSGFAGAMPNFSAGPGLAAEPDPAPATAALLSVRDGVDIKI